MPFKKPTRRTGITHFPLQHERMSQREVPPRGKKKEDASATTRSNKRGHRLSRKTGRAGTISSENDFKGSGGKGGNTGGSRAGLLACRKSSKGDLATECYVLNSSKNNDATRISQLTLPGTLRFDDGYCLPNRIRKVFRRTIFFDQTLISTKTFHQFNCGWLCELCEDDHGDTTPCGIRNQFDQSKQPALRHFEI